MSEIETIKLNEVEYVRKDSVNQCIQNNIDGLKYVIVRTYSAGVFAGYLKERNGQEVTLLNARRLWQWYGAASLSQLAVDGVSKPDQCKFPCELSEVLLLQVIEIIPCTIKAFNSIKGVKVWSA